MDLSAFLSRFTNVPKETEDPPLKLNPVEHKTGLKNILNVSWGLGR